MKEFEFQFFGPHGDVVQLDSFIYRSNFTAILAAQNRAFGKHVKVFCEGVCVYDSAQSPKLD